MTVFDKCLTITKSNKKPVTPPEGTDILVLSQYTGGQYFVVTGTDDFEVDWQEFLARRKSYSPEEVAPLRRSDCGSHF